MLTEDQIKTYQEMGLFCYTSYFFKKLKAMRDDLDKWIEESKKHNKNYGETPKWKSPV